MGGSSSTPDSTPFSPISWETLKQHDAEAQTALFQSLSTKGFAVLSLEGTVSQSGFLHYSLSRKGLKDEISALETLYTKSNQFFGQTLEQKQQYAEKKGTSFQ